MASRKAFLLRIDPALWAELEAWAQDELPNLPPMLPAIDATAQPQA